jgi:membrane protein YdbS with pleckstrin-like domain
MDVETPVAEAEAVGTAPFERLDARVVPYWLVSGLVSWLLLVAIAAGVLFWFRERLPDDRRWIWATVGGGAVLLLLWSLVSPSWAWHRWRFVIDDDLLLARHGIVFHEEKAIPISRLQHVDLTRGPIERLFGLATLVVYTAGTEGASFRLPGLAVARAEELRDRILEARGDDVV